MAKKPTIVDALFDYAVANPDGFTIADFADAAGIKVASAQDAVTRLRKALGSDTINLICAPTTPGQKWEYRLVGTLDDAKWWASNRLDDAETRLTTINSVANSLVSATDGRTVEGRRARTIRKVVGRLIEDLQDIHAEAGLS